MSTLRERDVVRYDPPAKSGWLSGSDPNWCVEGMAVVERFDDGELRLVDTYWHSRGPEVTAHRPDEVTHEVLFNLDDYDALDRNERYKWERYAPADRAVVTHQHRLQRDLYVRKGAVEDHATIVENAREKLREAEDELRSAKRRRGWAQEDLDALIESAVVL